ncbi:hypothetical protein AMC90_CH01796 [Rhizobium phaseoli]|nr:hypothetical protein [Rhizobium phaseoli]ANL27634.1 hypothetical protein AMC90_CH01796 [Rhizobium phaseoli]
MSQPSLILTAHVGDEGFHFFNELRTRFFPPERNFLRAHITVFHKLAPKHRLQIDDILRQAGQMMGTVEVKVTGVRNMGNGVSFVLESEILARVRGFESGFQAVARTAGSSAMAATRDGAEQGALAEGGYSIRHAIVGICQKDTLGGRL